jgi:peptide/nickel transport system permease protein
MTSQSLDAATAMPAAEGVDAAPSASATRRSVVRRVVLGSVPGALASGFLLLLVVVACFAPLITPHDPNAQSIGLRFAGPSAQHWLGTDSLGRDVLSRLIVAARIAVLAPTISVGFAILVGVPAGMWAGLRKGWVDVALSRIADALLSLPGLAFAMAIVAVLGPGLFHAMIALGVTFAPRAFRIVRAATLSVAEETYTDAARAIGLSNLRIMRSHVLANIVAPLLVQTTIMMGAALVAEASLSFLGLGVQLPDASWGTMLNTAYQHQYQNPTGLLPPAIALALTVLAFNTLGDAIRDVVGVRRTR